MKTSHFEESQGDIEFSVPAAGKPCKTHYWLYGDLKSGNSRPLVCLHGGPGVPHDYISPIKNLAPSGTPVIFYDQLGCGKSTHLQEKKGDTAFWTVALFLDELDNLLAHFGIQDDYDLLGQSWGGMLASEHAIRQPKGLNKLVIADSPADMATWVEEASKLRVKLPKDIQEKLDKHEADGTTDSEEYEEAMMVFYDLHVCRVKPMPEELVRSFGQLKEDATVYNTMNGPSEFTISGSLKTWSVVDKVHKINVPTLLINGRYDEATDVCVNQFFNSIPKVKWVRFAESSHMPQLEEPEECLKVIADFLK